MRNSSHRLAKLPSVSAFTRNSVNVCQRSVTTKYSSPRRRQLKSSTSRAWPTAWPSCLSRSSSSLPSRNSHEVTITCDAPASIHSAALSAVTPPPTCSPPGQAASASRAASSLPLPSLITWPPRRLSRRYSSANQAGGFSETKWVRSAFGWLSSMEPPTICFTLPSCRSMHGLNTRRAYGRLAKRSSLGGGNLSKRRESRPCLPYDPCRG